jgi:uncharacterized membrane protein
MLKFCNHTSETLWVCIEWYHPNCSDGGDWEKAGWWEIGPGQCKVPYGDDLDDVNRFWYFFAHNASGNVWAGPFTEWVPSRVFSWCKNTSSTDSRQVGMRQLDSGDAENLVVNLT